MRYQSHVSISPFHKASPGLRSFVVQYEHDGNTQRQARSVFKYRQILCKLSSLAKQEAVSRKRYTCHASLLSKVTSHLYRRLKAEIVKLQDKCKQETHDRADLERAHHRDRQELTRIVSRQRQQVLDLQHQLRVANLKLDNLDYHSRIAQLQNNVRPRLGTQISHVRQELQLLCKGTREGG